MGLEPLELSFNSYGSPPPRAECGWGFNEKFGEELVVVHATFPCLVSLRCMLGVNVEVFMKSILHWFVERQTWHAKMPWKPCSNLHVDSNHALKPYPTWWVLYAKQPTPNQESQQSFYFWCNWIDVKFHVGMWHWVCGCYSVHISCSLASTS